jgi:hypothetical protein
MDKVKLFLPVPKKDILESVGLRVKQGIEDAEFQDRKSRSGLRPLD